MSIEIRDAGPDHWSLSGWATTWATDGRSYFVVDPDGSAYRERVMRNAFSSATEGRDSVELRREHLSDGPVFATTRTGTLRFEDADHGLLTAAALSKRDPETVQVVADVKARELRGLSVGMVVTDDHWGTAPDGRTQMREIIHAHLSEVSLVRSPANPAAEITDVRHETRSAGRVEYRSVPVAWRAANQYGSHQPCPTCDGTGECQDCDPPGSGQAWVSNDSESRRDFTAAQLESLGKAGKALWLDGHWAYPTPMRSDYDNAVISVGRTPGKNRTTVRKYLMARAKAEGWPVPASWNSDGTTKSAGRSVLLPLNDTPDLRDEYEFAKLKARR